MHINIRTYEPLGANGGTALDLISNGLFSKLYGIISKCKELVQISTKNIAVLSIPKSGKLPQAC